MQGKPGFHNILIIKPGAIGDILQLTPVIRALHSRYPHAEISLLLGSRITSELFQHNEHVRRTLVFDKSKHSFTDLLQLWRSLHRRRYDLVINFQRSNMKTWFLATAAVPCRFLVYHKARTGKIHAVLNYLDTLAPLEIPPSDLRLELKPGSADRSFARKLIAGLGESTKPLIALNPGASHPVNRWPTDRFADLADRLAAELSAKVIVIGGPEDISLAREIGSRSRSNPVLLSGKTTLLQLAALLEQCRLLVTGDTGPMHLATAVGVNVVALFGAADPERTGPVGSNHRVVQARDLSCVPCGRRICRHTTPLACMKNIPVSAVFDAVNDMLQREPSNQAPL